MSPQSIELFWYLASFVFSALVVSLFLRLLTESHPSPLERAPRSPLEHSSESSQRRDHRSVHLAQGK